MDVVPWTALPLTVSVEGTPTMAHRAVNGVVLTAGSPSPALGGGQYGHRRQHYHRRIYTIYCSPTANKFPVSNQHSTRIKNGQPSLHLSRWYSGCSGCLSGYTGSGRYGL